MTRCKHDNDAQTCPHMHDGGRMDPLSTQLGPPVTRSPQPQGENVVDMEMLDKLFEPGWLYRCDYCGWPLAAGIREGCVDGECSMRPRKSNADTPRKATVRYLVARARRAQEAEKLLAHAERCLRAIGYGDIGATAEIRAFLESP